MCALCSPSLFLDINWKVHEDLCGSDHFPTFLHFKHKGQNDNLQRWRLGKADWSEFEQMCKLNLKREKFESLENPMEQYTSTLHKILEKTISKTSTNPKRLNIPWWNEKCQDAL